MVQHMIREHFRSVRMQNYYKLQDIQPCNDTFIPYESTLVNYGLFIVTLCLYTILFYILQFIANVFRLFKKTFH